MRFPSDMFIRTLYINQLDIKNNPRLIDDLKSRPSTPETQEQIQKLQNEIEMAKIQIPELEKEVERLQNIKPTQP